MGTVFSGNGKSEEAQHLGLLVSGPGQGFWQDPHPESADLFTLKGIIEAIIGTIPTFVRTEDNLPATSFISNIMLGKMCIGQAAQISPARSPGHGRPAPGLCSRDRSLVYCRRKPVLKTQYEELPKFPSISRDVAMEVDLSLSSGEIESVLSKVIKSPLLESFRLFDLFHDKSGQRLDCR